FLRRQPRGLGGGMAVVGGGGAKALEVGAALAMGVEIAGEVCGIAAGDFTQPVEVGGEALEVRIDHGIGAVGRHYAPGPAAVADLLVPVQVVKGAVGGGDGFDVEALVE